MPAKNKNKLYLIAHNIRSLHNVGSLFRTADGAGVDKIILSGYTGSPPCQKISKVALGAEENVPFEKTEDINSYIKDLKKQGFKIIALETKSQGKNIYKFKPKFPLALLIGHEKRGLPAEILELADQILEIPMRGQKKSLNVAVAAGVALYQILRDCHPSGDPPCLPQAGSGGRYLDI
ncbi:MAG: TrmH family RNA methyltransferase [Patescibacteria group bacterium]|nr:TrmH family RNA methyltransferase [Patescibacteria group bacterium]